MNEYLDKINNIFLVKIPYKNDKIIYFNRTNGAIFMVNKDEEKKLMNNQLIDTNLLNEIEESKIFIFDEIKFNDEYNNFLVTIELSTTCNLKCLYCYQSGDCFRNVIENETLLSTYDYVKSVFLNNNNIDYLIVGIIGGEPLIHYEKVIEIIEKMKDITNKLNKKVYFHIDTNGTIDFSKIFNNYDNIELSISLTNKSDHNTNRPSKTFDSFSKIIENIKKCTNNNNKLSIRYNTNHINISKFKTFVKYISSNFPIVYNIDPMYTDNYEFNRNYKNELSIDEFIKWNSTTAIDILINYGYPITGTIPTTLQLCSAYQPFSCKVHSDGMISLCDAMKYEKTLNIKDLSNNIYLLKQKFYKYKSYNPLKDDFCKFCSKIVQCQGQLLCRNTDKCKYQKRYDERSFISKYVEYVLLNEGKYFINM